MIQERSIGQMRLLIWRGMGGHRSRRQGRFSLSRGQFRHHRPDTRRGSPRKFSAQQHLSDGNPKRPDVTFSMCTALSVPIDHLLVLERFRSRQGADFLLRVE